MTSQGQTLEPVGDARSVAAERQRYLLALALVAAMTLVGAAVSSVVQPVNLAMFYLTAVVIAAMYLGRWPSVLVALLSVIVLDFFFVPPRHTLAVADTQYLLTFAGLLIVGLVISSLTSQAREQAQAAQSREAQAVALYEFSRDLGRAEELPSILNATIAHVGKTFCREAVIFLPQADKELSVAAASTDFHPDKDDTAIAERIFQHEEAAGRGIESLPAAGMWCLPLQTPRGVVGVLGVARPACDPRPAMDQRRLLETFAGQAALAIERAQLAERAQQAYLLEATEKLYSVLLNSVSHDLRTPLVTITGAFSSLETAEGHLDEATRASLARAGREEAERLNRLVGNLLDMTRIEAGALKLTEEPVDAGEAIGVVLDRLGERLNDRQLRLDVPVDLPPVPMDMPLIVQALTNIVDNAAKYSPDGSPIDIRATQTGDCIRIEVLDRGIGIPTSDLEHIFDRFYRVQRPNRVRGTGLGLSISKGIVEAHGGTIEASNRPDGGTRVMIALPLRSSLSGEG